MINIPFVDPVNLNAIIERMIPNISVCNTVCIFPVFGSGRTSSKLLPCDMRISWAFDPEKFP